MSSFTKAIRPASRLLTKRAPQPAILRPQNLRTVFPVTAKGYAQVSGSSQKEMTVREALTDAMASEMERNEKVFVLGEEVAQYNGAYKVTKGLLDRFGEKRVIGMVVQLHSSFRLTC